LEHGVGFEALPVEKDRWLYPVQVGITGRWKRHQLIVFRNFPERQRVGILRHDLESEPGMRVVSHLSAVAYDFPSLHQTPNSCSAWFGVSTGGSIFPEERFVIQEHDPTCGVGTFATGPLLNRSAFFVYQVTREQRTCPQVVNADHHVRPIG
jgi:hypothetical protein